MVVSFIPFPKTLTLTSVINAPRVCGVKSPIKRLPKSSPTKKKMKGITHHSLLIAFNSQPTRGKVIQLVV